MHGRPLNWITSTTGSLHFLTQFINSQGLHFLLAISMILSSKNAHLDFLTVFLNSFQFSMLQDYQYLSRFLRHSSFHHALECFVMLTILEYLSQMFSMLIDKLWTVLSRTSMLWMDEVSNLSIKWVSSLRKCFSSSLPVVKKHRLIGMCLSMMRMSTDIGAWSEESLQLGWI